jgi:hypothetical protein
VRLCYPLNDTPLFSYPAISIRSFRWEQMPGYQRLIWQVLVAVWVGFFLYLLLVGSTHHQITWADFNAVVLWRLLVCVFIAALFPLIVLPILLAFQGARTTSGAKSLFYQEWTSAFAGTGKGGGRIVFFAEDAETFCIEPSTFRDVAVQVVIVTFRKRYFFKRGGERFVIQADAEHSLEKMIVWARDRGIDVKEIPAAIQRRS